MHAIHRRISLVLDTPNFEQIRDHMQSM